MDSTICQLKPFAKGGIVSTNCQFKNLSKEELLQQIIHLKQKNYILHQQANVSNQTPKFPLLVNNTQNSEISGISLITNKTAIPPHLQPCQSADLSNLSTPLTPSTRQFTYPNHFVALPLQNNQCTQQPNTTLNAPNLCIHTPKFPVPQNLPCHTPASTTSTIQKRHYISTKIQTK